MGTHQKSAGVEVISFLKDLGIILSYHVEEEEIMFPGNSTSPSLDVTWRKNRGDKYPMFVFEVESSATKSSTDNAMKVFAEKTKTFPKPLFFFHIFVKQNMKTRRIENLNRNYDSINYNAYLLNATSDSYQFMSDIINQHLRITSYLNLHGLIDLLENQKVLDVTSGQILNELLNLGYDKNEETNFIMELEQLIADKNFNSIKVFYLSYLPKYLAYETRPLNNYAFMLAVGYSDIIHYAIMLLFGNDEPNDKLIFKRLQEIENSYDFLSLWEPSFGLSEDHDFLLLFEFPLILVMLCIAFKPTSNSIYFSRKLKKILSSVTVNHFTIFGFIWLLTASRIANDKKSYDFARSAINDHGGIPMKLLLSSFAFNFSIDELKEFYNAFENPQNIPELSKWAEWIVGFNKKLENSNNSYIENILSDIIGGFLLGEDRQRRRFSFALFCLQKSL